MREFLSVWVNYFNQNMDIFLNLLFAGLIFLYILPSLLNTNISKRDSYLSSCFDITLMMLGFYWEQNGLIFLVISIVLCLCLYFCIFYFRIYKENDFKKEKYSTPKNKIITYLSTLLFVVPMFIESNIIMVSLLAIFVITDRVLFYRKFNTLF